MKRAEKLRNAKKLAPWKTVSEVLDPPPANERR